MTSESGNFKHFYCREKKRMLRRGYDNLSHIPRSSFYRTCINLYAYFLEVDFSKCQLKFLATISFNGKCITGVSNRNGRNIFTSIISYLHELLHLLLNRILKTLFLTFDIQFNDNQFSK